MNLLKRVIIGIVVILIMTGMTLLLDTYSPSSIYFHRQFLFCMQLVVIAWMLIMIILFLFRLQKTWFARYLPVFLILVVLGFDVIFYRLLQKPESIPAFAVPAFSDFYTRYERNIVQYEPCSVYDSSLFYKVIPGLQFRFGNIEYENQYRVNGESFRSDEASLFGPSVICTGDSYTFGWGVENDETFPSVLRSRMNMSVLNAGNSSYGTVRELKQLSKADTSVVDYLVIQYCRNDAGENAAFVQNDGKLAISSAADYQLARKRYFWAKEFFPGKYFISITSEIIRTELRNLIRGSRVPAYLRQDQTPHARNFLEVIRLANLNSRIRLIVFDLNSPVEMSNHFVKAVDSIAREQRYSDIQRRLVTADLSDYLTRSDYYTLDTHLKASGHKKIADTLAAIITGLSKVEDANRSRRND